MIRALDRRLNGHLRARIGKSNFTGAEGNTLLHPTAGLLPAAYLLLVGIGAGDTSATPGAKLGPRRAKKPPPSAPKSSPCSLPWKKIPESAAGAIVEGAALAGYQFNKYRSNGKAAPEVKSLTLFRSGLTKTAGLQKAVDSAQSTMPAVFLARDLVNEPPSVATANFLGAAGPARLPRPRTDGGSLEQKKDRSDETGRTAGG